VRGAVKNKIRVDTGGTRQDNPLVATWRLIVSPFIQARSSFERVIPVSRLRTFYGSSPCFPAKLRRGHRSESRFAGVP